MSKIPTPPSACSHLRWRNFTRSVFMTWSTCNLFLCDYSSNFCVWLNIIILQTQLNFSVRVSYGSKKKLPHSPDDQLNFIYPWISVVTISDIYYVIIGAKRINDMILSLFRYPQKIGRKCHQSNSYFNFICCLLFVLLLLFSNKLQSKYECRKVAKSFIYPYLYKIFALPGCHGLLTQYYHMCFINMISTW